MLLYLVNLADNESDKKFIEELYIKYIPWLRYKAYTMVKDSDISNDLAHDCMVKIINHIETVKNLPDNKVRSYLTVCIVNTTINYLNKASKESTLKNLNLSDSFNLPDTCSVIEEVEQKYTYQMMYVAYKKLPLRDQSIIEMKITLELSDEHMSEILNVTKDSVRVLLSRSMKKLKEEMKKMEALS